ncbi:MAG: hypothetical protein ACRECE_10680 [Xanthobacteraceae bacterium]
MRSHFLLGEHGDEFLVVRHHGMKLVGGAASDVQKKRNEAYAFGQKPADLFGYARTHGRIDHADHATP